MSALATESYRQVFMPHYLEFDLCSVMKIIVASRMRKANANCISLGLFTLRWRLSKAIEG